MDEYQASKIDPDLERFLSSGRLIELISELQLPDEVPDIPIYNGSSVILGKIFGNDIDFNPELDKVVQAVSKQTLGEYVEALRLKKMKDNPDRDTSIVVTRSYWSQIINGKNKNPSKLYLLRIAIALRLTLRETEMLFRKAGYSLTTDESNLEAIVGYFISKGTYGLYEIDTQLEMYNQPTLLPIR